MTTDPQLIVLGAVTGAFGVRGEVRLKSFCAEPSNIASYGPLTDDAGRSYTVTLTRPVKSGYAARLSDIKTKEQADSLRGQKLYAPRSALPDLPSDEYYHSDLVGLEAVDPGGVVLGNIHAVHDHGAGDILELRGQNGTVLVPFTLAIVPVVDVRVGRLVIDPPDGLLPDPKP